MNLFANAVNGHIQHLETYISRGNKIVQSVQHKGLFIINYPDGRFCSVNSSCESMLLLHPPDKNQKFLEHTRFNFNTTQAYKPNPNKKEKWQREPKFTTRLN